MTSVAVSEVSNTRGRQTFCSIHRIALLNLTFAKCKEKKIVSLTDCAWGVENPDSTTAPIRARFKNLHTGVEKASAHTAFFRFLFALAVVNLDLVTL